MRPICLAVLLLCAVAAASTGDLKAVDTSPLFDGFEDKLRRLQKRFCNVCYDLLEFPEAIFKVPRDAFDGIAWFVQVNTNHTHSLSDHSCCRLRTD